VKKIIAVLILVLLSACNSRYATNGETVYLQSKNGPHLDVPVQGADKISHFYDLPQPTQAPKISIEPPAPELAS
jgi:uncharacterized lipoprotein